ncbi:unnamed protein product [Auanema sp. JU1783]|nr:unnamed protein product [Auanema sp. JU1783]
MDKTPSLSSQSHFGHIIPPAGVQPGKGGPSNYHPVSSSLLQSTKSTTPTKESETTTKTGESVPSEKPIREKPATSKSKPTGVTTATSAKHVPSSQSNSSITTSSITAASSVPTTSTVVTSAPITSSNSSFTTVSTTTGGSATLSAPSTNVTASTSNPIVLSSATPSTSSILKDEDKKKEIYGFDAPFMLFSSTWSCATDAQRRFRIAVSSFIEEYSNKISIVQLDEDAGELVLRSSFDHPYPATKLMWIPDSKGNYPDLIATSGDYLRLWRIGADNQAKVETLLNTNRTAEYCAPLTSFDWNELDLNLIGTSSIDTTCTIWQLETGQALGSVRGPVDGSVRTQLIAHDKEVFDIAFSRGSKDIFGSVGADGSVRLFDLRHLEHSTIVFESSKQSSLLRLAWNRNDHNYMATFASCSNEVLILDMRVPCTPVARLSNHKAAINGVSWAPHSSSHLCTGADDSQALIWDVHEMPRPVDDPILAYQAGGEVNQIHWSTAYPDWISICYGNRLEILRV